MAEKKNQPITREKLYQLVWSEPMVRVAKQFGVSSSYMARVCTELEVPRPPRGYWAKLTAGKKTKHTPLPDPQPGTPLEWARYGQYSNHRRPLPGPPLLSQKRKRRIIVRGDNHIILNGTKEHFISGRLSREGEYLIPSKKLLVDLVVSKAGLDPALEFAKKLFLKFETYGYRVVFAPRGEYFYRAPIESAEIPSSRYNYNNLWQPWRCTVVYIGTLAIGLTIIETAEEVEVRYNNGKYIRLDQDNSSKSKRYSSGLDWTTHKMFSTGKLCLQAYSPYPRAKWVKKWHENQPGSLITKVNSIIKELEDATVKIAKLVEEGERQAEIELKKHEANMEKWRIEEERRRSDQALANSKKDLYDIISKWAEANRIEQFFKDIVLRADNLNQSERQKLFERLEKARQLIGTTDALEHFLMWKSADERL